MKRSRKFSGEVLAAVCCLGLFATIADAAMIIAGGSASITLNEGTAASISEFDAYFNASTTRADTLALPAPGNAAFTEGAVVSLVDPIRPYGESVPAGTPGVSRTPQATTLTIEDTSNVLGSWTTSNDGFAFVGNSILGEQIAFTNMQRWTGPFTGVLVYGDFALRNTGSKLVLTSNIDFLNAAWADIGNPVISLVGNTLTITGDLLFGGGLWVLDPSGPLGAKFGEITVTANLVSDTPSSPVPEPSSIVLLSAACGGLGLVRRRRQAN